MEQKTSKLALDRLELRGQKVEGRGLLRAMQTIRAVETALGEAYLEGRFEGPLHLSVGQEGVAVGVAAAMERDDVLMSTHRGHGHALAFGLDPRIVVAEIVGDACGYGAGRGGSMHIVVPAEGFLGTNGIVGDGAGLVTGAGLKLQLERGKRVAVTIIGDGAMGTGVVYESLNLAKLWSLPIVFVCENNQYAEMTPTSVHISSEPSTRAEAFGLGTHSVPGTDVQVVLGAVREAIDGARHGSPGFVEVITYRWGGHYVGDPMLYRPEAQDQEWRRDHCPIRVLGERIGVDKDLEHEQKELEERARDLVAEVLSHDHLGDLRSSGDECEGRSGAS